MLADGRTVPDGATLEADLAIIGGGPAGITVALELAAEGRRIIVLESGGREPEADTDALMESTLTGEGYPLFRARQRFLGGTTNHWAGHCYPFSPFDFQTKPWLPISGWPIGRADLDPWYPRAFDLVQFGRGAFDWDPQSWRRRLGAPRDTQPLVGAVLEQRVEQIAAEADPVLGRSFAQYEGRLAAAPGVQLLLHSNVTEIVAEALGAHVRELAVACLGGPRFTVRAPLVVLAAGGVENARLLLASRSSLPPGLGNADDQVGRYFTDHLFFAQKLVPAGPDWVDPLLFPRPTAQGNTVLAHFRLLPEVLARERLSEVFFRIFPVTADGVRASRELMRDLATLDPQQIDWADFRTVAGDLPGIARHLWSRQRRDDAAPTLFDVVTRVEPPLDPDSRVTLTAETDALGVPRLELSWKVARQARESIVRASELFAGELGARGLGRLQATFTADDPWPEDMDVGYHHTCTTRMSADPKTGVVDRDLKVHGMDNLWVAGSSAFGTAGSGSPTMTLTALALRLADHLKGKLA